MINIENTSDIFDSVTLRLYTVIREATGKRADMMMAPDLLERGKNYIMTLLQNAALKEQFKNEPIMFYYNVASFAFAGGIAYADAWQKDVTQIKLGFVDTLIASQPDKHALAMDIMGIETEAEKNAYRGLCDDMFSEFIELMKPYWEKEDPRPFLFQGLLAFFQTGIIYRTMKK